MTNPDNSAEGRTSTVLQLPNGRFAPNNPGRKPGSVNRISNEALTSVRGMKDIAIEQLRAKLDKGDWDAIVFVLNRILPKDRAIQLDDMSPTTIATALANGEVTPEEGRAIATTIQRLNEIGELEQLRERLAEIEKLVAGDGKATR